LADKVKELEKKEKEYQNEIKDLKYKLNHLDIKIKEYDPPSSPSDMELSDLFDVTHPIYGLVG
jgi:peptidoglycan hydrolase CwlO-like protein